MQTLNNHPDWILWFIDNIKNGCNEEELIQILLKNDFSHESIHDQLQKIRLNLSLPNTSQNTLSSDTTHWAYAPSLTTEDNGYQVSKVHTKKLDIFVIENLLTSEECNQIIALGDSSLRPSTITIPIEDAEFRTSFTCDLGLLENPFMIEIDEKICKALGISQNFSEVTQLQKYEVGQQFKFHKDYFEPGSGEYQAHASLHGNRTWTFMVYLNTVPKGGGTHFRTIDHIFMPKTGQAVVWNNLLKDGNVNPNTFHAGLPVLEGSKYVITKWFREKPVKEQG
jgi:prolyl 4-hydroxylase